MYSKTKCDPELGKQVHAYLTEMGVETPMWAPRENSSRTEKIEQIEKHFSAIMEILGLDKEDDSLSETPLRVAKMFVNEVFYGLGTDAFPKCTTVENKMQYDEMVIERGVNVQSMCEHHFLPITGKATVAYVPNKKVLGLSKINRIVEYFSKRPQIQERLTEQIFFALKFILDTDDIAVIIDATHHCVMARGVEDTGSSTVTSRLGGGFKTDPAARAEFMRIAYSN